MSDEHGTVPAVITGMAVAAPTGLTVEQHWQAVLAGKTGIMRVDRFDPSRYPVRLAGLVPGFEPAGLVPRKLLPQTDLWTQLALYAGEMALADARVDPAGLDEYQMAVITSSSSGGNEFGQREMERLYVNGPPWVSAYQSIAWFYAATTGQVSIRHGMRGPCGVFCAEQAGGLDAIAQAGRLLHTGVSSLVVTGGTDASLSPYGFTAQIASGQLSTLDDPDRAYRPFDPTAAGHLPGEGGAILIAERQDTARARSAATHGTVAGHAAGFGPLRPGRPVLTGVIRRALADARLTPDDIDVVFADGAAQPDADRVEAEALATVFGRGGVPVTVPKTLTGRLYGGGAPLDVVTALLAIRDGVVPPTTGTERTDPEYGLDLVLDQPRERRLRAALVLARGYGGFTSALVLTAGTRSNDTTEGGL